MLGNFTYENPTKLYFGKDALSYLQEELALYGPKVQFIYGGGSIKRNGIYEKIMTVLQAAHKRVIEDGGVMPNPTLDKLYEGCRAAKEQNADLLLAVGGGSVCDYAKAVAVSAYCETDPWDTYYAHMRRIKNKIIPVGCVLTMAGTGSEMNGGSVITNTAEKRKIARVFDARVFPRFAVLNPAFTMTVPKYQMAAGCYDIMSHLMEQYFSGTDDTASDYIAEGMMRSLVHSSRQAIRDPQDYEARSNIMWLASWALNSFIGKGKSQDWMVHMLGQSLGAYTNATHGMTLAAVSLPYYRHIVKAGEAKFARFAQTVWQVRPDGKTAADIAAEGLQCLEAWMRSLGLVLHARELGMTEEMIPQIAEGVFITHGGYETLTREAVEDILQQSL